MKIKFYDKPFNGGNLRSGDLAIFPKQEEVYLGLDDNTTVKIYPFEGGGTNQLPTESEFIATANQTVFVITGKVLTRVNSYSNGIRDRQTYFSVSDDGIDTTIIFIAGKGLNDNVIIEYYE